MPTISRFYGIVIQMFWNDHAPPHFHALYGDDEAVIGLEGLTILRGHLPGRAMNLVVEWASQHRAELEEDWELCRSRQMPNRIDPLA
jgi:hypothetical protein